jgi:hypothetical protein
MKKIVFTFGRYNPPTIGHAELITYAVKLAHRTGADHRIYTSQSHDPSKNPLSPKQKMAFLRQIFPGVNFVEDPAMKTAFAICKKLADDGYEDVTFVVGDDRINEFRTQLGKYVKPKTAKDFDPKRHYPFKKFQVVSSGARKQGISGTDLRAAVRKGDFATFAKASAARDKALARKIFTATRTQLKEQYLKEQTGGMSRKDFHDKLMSFIDFTCDHLGIDEKPKFQYIGSDEYGDKNPVNQPSFASYSPGEKLVRVSTKNRHPMDIFRSVAHELVHHKQNLDGRLGKNIAKEGATGSKIENEANSEAGKVMRYFGAENPFYFDMQYVTEKAIILSGTPGSGKDRILKEAILPYGFIEVSSDNFHISEMRGNLVVNGTSDYNTIKTIKEALELKGYETMMVFVNTSNEVSRQRNEARATKGGRVITETTRFAKWKGAQESLEKYNNLFETIIEVNNNFDLNESLEAYENLIKSVSKKIEKFSMSEQDIRFENMLNEVKQYRDFSNNNRKILVGGAGNWGTPKLTNRLKSETPGEKPGQFESWKVLNLKNRIKEDNRKETPTRTMSTAPIPGDRIGDETGMAKGPGFGDNQSLDMTGVNANRQIDRWMVKEETRRRFKEKYGSLAEKKLKETAEKLARMESLTDPFDGTMGAVPYTTGNDDVRNDQAAADQEKAVIFGKKKYKKTK